MICDHLEDLARVNGYAAVVAYISAQDWGIFVHVDGSVEPTRAKAEEWVAHQSEARTILWSRIEQVTPKANLGEIREALIHSTRQEKAHCQEKMREELQKYDDRIEKLLAITHQPEGRPKSPSKGYSHSEKLAFVKGVIEELASVLPWARNPPFAYSDEEGGTSFYDHPQDLFDQLWQCDMEVLAFHMPQDKVVTVTIVWDNPAPEVIADFSWPKNDGIWQHTVQDAIDKVAKEFNYE